MTQSRLDRPAPACRHCPRATCRRPCRCSSPMSSSKPSGCWPNRSSASPPTASVRPGCSRSRRPTSRPADGRRRAGLPAALDSTQRDGRLVPDRRRRVGGHWCNVHIYMMRHGLLLDDLAAAQRQAALGSAPRQPERPRFRQRPRRHAVQRGARRDHRQPRRIRRVGSTS